MNEENFYSINRLLEFGMSIAVAHQMINTMNSAMANMHVSGAMNPIPNTSPQFYFVIIEGSQAGPFTEQEISRLISEKKVEKDTYIWKPGLPNWEIAEKLPEILKIVALSPPPFTKKEL